MGSFTNQSRWAWLQSRRCVHCKIFQRKWRIQVKIFKPILKFRDLKCLGQNKMPFFVDLMGRRNVKFVAENFLPLLVENAIIGPFTWKQSLLNVFVVDQMVKNDAAYVLHLKKI